MISLGIDPSLTATGIVILNDGKLLEKILIKTKPSEQRTALNELKRLMQIVKRIEGVIKKNKIEMVAMEGLSYGARNTSALIQLSGLNYLIRELLHNNDIPFTIVAPTTLKKFICGKGNGGKDVLMMETYKRYGVTLSDNNLCDAYGLAKIAEALIGDIKLTQFQKEVITLLTNKEK